MSAEVILTFDTTHMALWAEEVARDAAIPVEVIPAPPERQARCDLALALRPVDLERLTTLLTETGVQFGMPDSSAGRS